MTNHKLAIVGGGFLGTELAKAFDADMDVTLIERASHFTHTPAMIRAMVDPTLLDRALIPYDSLLTHGRVVRGEAFMMVATLGDWVTSKMKGRDLFINKYRKMLGKN